MIGKILGNRYQILREVGSGGMAWVYLAEDINKGRLVAVKVLYPQFSEDIAYIQRFNREARLASTLSDQHIVRMLDYGATRDVHYLVMEYIEGQDLRSIIDERGSLPWREALHIIDQLAIALEHAHLHGIVHRDIKPQNLMITGDNVLKVLDFGIARARMLPSLTQSGFVGSPYYISPEQAMGEEVDIRSDLYSSGIVFFETLCGRVPYEANSPWSIISQHIASEPPNINLIGTQVPEAINLLLHRMVAKRPEDRFQTPTALREAIACVLENRPLPAVVGSPPATPDRIATADELYQRAQEAMRQEDWQRAVDLLNQVIKLDPERAQATEELANAGRQARLDALYQTARRAMEGGRWQEAIDELSEVVSVEPTYRDAAAMLEQAQTAQKEANLAQRAADLYKEGVAHIKASEWEDAAHCLRQVQWLSPGYKDTQRLLAKVERHLQPDSGRLARLGLALRRVAPALILVLVLLGIVIGASLLIQNNNGPTDTAIPLLQASENPASTYREAKKAFRADDWDRAIELFDEVLASDPGYEDAASLREQAETNRALEQMLNEGYANYSAERWSEAIDALNRLRQTDATFRPEETEGMLCDAYLQRGQEKVAGYMEESGTAPIEAALNDFKLGLTICTDNQALSTQQTFASSFLLALEAMTREDWNTVVRELTQVVAAEPGYANGHARHMLYVALVTRGDIRQQAGDLAGTLSDYERAIALDEPDTLDVVSRRSEVLRALSGGAPSGTVQPGETPPPTPSYKYGAPTLTSPENEALFQGEFTPIMLEWDSVGALAADEYYDVTIMHYVGEEPRYWGGAVQETRWQVPLEAGFREAGNDRFYWWVTVRQANTAPAPGELDLALSPPSNARIFYWGE